MNRKAIVLTLMFLTTPVLARPPNVGDPMSPVYKSTLCDTVAQLRQITEAAHAGGYLAGSAVYSNLHRTPNKYGEPTCAEMTLNEQNYVTSVEDLGVHLSGDGTARHAWALGTLHIVKGIAGAFMWIEPEDNIWPIPGETAAFAKANGHYRKGI